MKKKSIGLYAKVHAPKFLYLSKTVCFSNVTVLLDMTVSNDKTLKVDGAAFSFDVQS